MSSKVDPAPRPLDSDPYIMAADVHRKERGSLYASLRNQNQLKSKSSYIYSTRRQVYTAATQSRTEGEDLRHSGIFEVHSDDSFDLLGDIDSVMSDAPLIHSSRQSSTAEPEVEVLDEVMPLVQLTADEAMPLVEAEPDLEMDVEEVGPSMGEIRPSMELELLTITNARILPFLVSSPQEDSSIGIGTNTGDSQNASQLASIHQIPNNLDHALPRPGTSKRRRSSLSDREAEQQNASTKRRRSSPSDSEAERPSAKSRASSSSGSVAEEEIVLQSLMDIAPIKQVRVGSHNLTITYVNDNVPSELLPTISQADDVSVGGATLVSALGESQVLDGLIASGLLTDVPVHDITVLQQLPAIAEFMARDQHDHTLMLAQPSTAEGPSIPSPSSTPAPILTLTTTTRMNTGIMQVDHRLEGEVPESQPTAFTVIESNEPRPAQDSLLPCHQASKLNTSHPNTVNSSNFLNHFYGHATPSARSAQEQHEITAVHSMNHFHNWQTSDAILNTSQGQNSVTPNNSHQNANNFQGSINGFGSSWLQSSAVCGDFNQYRFQEVNVPPGTTARSLPTHPSHDDDGDADDESELERYHGNGKYPNRDPRNCGEESHLFKKRLRENLRNLLGYRRGITKLVSATRDECETFARTGSFRDGPSLDQFRLDFISKLKSPWNRRAADIFMDHYADIEGDDFNAKQAIEDSFWVTFKTLKHIYAQDRTPSPNITARELKKKATNANGRKYNRRQRRANACYYYEGLSPELAKYAELWKRLSPDACSGDEEVTLPSGDTVHVIIEPRWRSDRVRKWFRVFDALHMVRRFEGGIPKQGNWPTVRTETNPARVDKTCKAVKQLPRNFYDDQWYNGLNDLERSHINAQPEVSLDFAPELLRTVKQYSGLTCRADRPLARELIDVDTWGF